MSAVSKSDSLPTYHLSYAKSPCIRKIGIVVTSILILVAAIGLNYSTLKTPFFYSKLSLLLFSLCTVSALLCLRIPIRFTIQFKANFHYFKDTDLSKQFERDFPASFYYMGEGRNYLQDDPILSGSDASRMENFKTYLMNSLKVNPAEIYPYATQAAVADFIAIPLRTMVYRATGMDASYGLPNLRNPNGANTGFKVYSLKNQLHIDITTKFEKVDPKTDKALCYILAKASVNLVTGDVILKGTELSDPPGHISTYLI